MRQRERAPEVTHGPADQHIHGASTTSTTSTTQLTMDAPITATGVSATPIAHLEPDVRQPPELPSPDDAAPPDGHRLENDTIV